MYLTLKLRLSTHIITVPGFLWIQNNYKTLHFANILAMVYIKRKMY